MICRFCNSEMDYVYSDDNGVGSAEVDICYNLYTCPDCLCSLREDVWNFKGKVWVYNGEIYKEGVV